MTSDTEKYQRWIDGQIFLNVDGGLENFLSYEVLLKFDIKFVLQKFSICIYVDSAVMLEKERRENTVYVCVKVIFNYQSKSKNFPVSLTLFSLADYIVIRARCK